ncbi:Cell division protein FtsA [Candidatus Entotheonellaceae bacterium PAL068K]
MWFTRNQPLVGIDIGTHTIKLVQLKRVGKIYQLLHFGVMPLMPGAIIDGAIMDASAVVEAIRNLVRMEKIKTKRVATAISGQAVIVKKIRVPQMTEKELVENIQWEAAQHIPFEISEVNIDFQILPALENSEDNPDDQIDVLLVAARKSNVDDYTSLLVESGLHPIVVDADMFALENEYEINNELEDNVVALVDIGASTMNINILKHNMTIFQRDIAIGGNNYTAAIQKELNLAYEQAEALKMGVGFTAKIGKEKILSLMAETSEELCEEMQRSFEFFRSTTAEQDIHKMVISGGCARIRGLEQFLRHRLRLTVEVADPFQNLKCNEKVFDPEYLQAMAPVAAVGVGLALRRMNDA